MTLNENSVIIYSHLNADEGQVKFFSSQNTDEHWCFTEKGVTVISQITDENGD